MMFPTPLPDESIYSLVCRYMALTFPVKYRVSKNLFGHETSMAGPESLGRSLAYLHEQGCKQFWPRLEDMVRATTAYNLYGIFTRKRDQAYLFKTIANFYPGQRHVLYRGFYHPSNKVDCLKYCPSCVESDIREYGVGYWHRSHSLPFVFCCWKHGDCLVEVADGKKAYRLPGVNKSIGKMSADETDQKLAKLTYDILKKANPEWLNRKLICDVYSKVLSEKHYKNLTIAANQLQKDIEKEISPKTIQDLSIRNNFGPGVERKWVMESMNAATLCHIQEQLLIILKLFGEWKALNLAAMKY